MRDTTRTPTTGQRFWPANRVVTTLDRNPQILTRLLKVVDTTVNSATGRIGQ